MDYQTKLDSLHREIVFALCNIQKIPEGLFPFYVQIEENTADSLDSGTTCYFMYSLTEIYPDGMCLLENPCTGIEEEKALHTICIDSLTELWNAYRYLSGDETTSRITCLLQTMDSIAKALITGPYITDFTVHDTNYIRRTKAKTPFVWFIYKSGTHLYQTDERQEIKKIKSMLEHYEEYSKSDFCLYRYDGKKLLPVFPKTLHEWIKNQLTTDN